MQPIESNCQKRRCKHFQGIKPVYEHDFIFHCKAFPLKTGGIPDKISMGGDKHFSPFKGQKNTIVFGR